MTDLIIVPHINSGCGHADPKSALAVFIVINIICVVLYCVYLITKKKHDFFMLKDITEMSFFTINGLAILIALTYLIRSLL